MVALLAALFLGVSPMVEEDVRSTPVAGPISRFHRSLYRDHNGHTRGHTRAYI